jgi:ATP-binding cassette subfamily B protein AbcA/BmrA
VVVNDRNSSLESLLRLMRMARPSGPTLAAAAIVTLMAAAGTLVFPMLTKGMVDKLSKGALDMASVMLLAGVMVGVAATSALSAFLLNRVGYDMIAVLRSLLVEKLLKLPVASFDEESTGERVSRVLNDCQLISELATRQAANLLSGALMLFGAIVVLLFLDARLTLTMIGCVVAAFLVVIPLVAVIEKLARSIQDRTAKLGGILTHVLSEIRLVKAFSAEARERERSRREIQDIRRLGIQVAKISSVLAPLTSLSLTAAILVILVYGSARVSDGSITIGTLTAFILYIVNVAVPMIQLTTFLEELQKARGASARIAALLVHEEEPAGGDALPDTHEALEFRGVAFRYPGRDTTVLHGIDLTFRPGTTTALVGASGNGKTTVLSLILRFYAPSEGAIVYGGRPIDEYALSAWRERIGYVAQSAPIMPGTVRDNILYGLSGTYTDEQVCMAAEKAGALAFIRQMPQDLDTILSEQGSNLSGGQRQRIAIARMFLRNPGILILDEATSSLDSETEHQVKLALDALMQGRTNIVVAHRLSTIMHAERIYFLDGGRVSGDGNHEELLRSNAHYARLVARQFRNPVREAAEERVPELDAV